MAGGTVNFNLDELDDSVLPDGIPSFDGGQFSNLRANLLQPNQSAALGNCDVDKLGKLRTRRGTVQVGTTTPANVANKIIQGLTSYQTKDYNYIVAAHNRKLWSFNGTTWDQIALGGVADDEPILIARKGTINHATDYAMGETVLTVDGITGIVAAGEKLYFTNNMRTDPFEYIIADHAETGGNTTSITLEEPGLVFTVKDNWKFVVMRPATVNHPSHGRYAAGDTTIAIDGYAGDVNDGEVFVIQAENINHTISSHTSAGGNTIGLTFTPGLQADWIASDADTPVVFAQGNDALYFCDGVGPIYGWNGKTLMKIGTFSLLDQVGGSVNGQQRTKPPTGCKILVWFLNRLIASGIAAEPDAVYFSDFFDASAWDQDYQKTRIGGGESDPITGLLAWTDLNMLVFKKNSIYVVNLDPTQNPNPDDPTLLIASFAVKQLHKKIGCPAPQSAVQVGGGSTTPGSDVFFVDGDKKVHSIRRVMAAETQQEVGQAMSLPIQDVLDHANRDYIERCTAIYHNEHYILGFPSLRLTDSDMTRPNTVAVYNLLTQSWCGVWNWAPTCFAMRTDLGSYSKLIFGDVEGNVVQWMDDVSLDEETPDCYQDMGADIATTILTRAITFSDYYSFKTGLSVEFEFDESVSAAVTVKVILDKVTQNALIAVPFTSLSAPRVRLRVKIPFTLPASPGLMFRAFDLQRYGTFRELQFMISTAADKLALRSIRVTGFMDTIRLQTRPPL